MEKAFNSHGLTFHSRLVRREDAGVSAGRGADVQVELDVLLQSEALFVFTPGEDGFVVLLLVVTADTNAACSILMLLLCQQENCSVT